MLRVVQLVARDHSSVLSAATDLFDQDLTALAFIIVAPLCALMELTWKEFLTGALADRDLVGTLSALLTKQGNNLSTTAWAILDSCWSLLAGLTGPLVTHLLASVLTTIQSLTA